jgi:hypothetical protein
MHGDKDPQRFALEKAKQPGLCNALTQQLEVVVVFCVVEEKQQPSQGRKVCCFLKVHNIISK